jgi:hypothetical protein
MTWSRTPVRVLAAVGLGAALTLVAPAAPVRAQPLTGCTAATLNHVVDLPLNGRGDFVRYTCSYFSPWRLYYWALSDIRNAHEDLEEFADALGHYVDAGVWEGILQGGFGLLPASQQHRMVYVAHFQLYDSSKQTIFRTLALRILMKHSTNGGASWGTCGDTGWQQSSGHVARFQIARTYLTPKCGDGRQYQTSVAARFISATSGQWVNTGWMNVGTIYVPPAQ